LFLGIKNNGWLGSNLHIKILIKVQFVGKLSVNPHMWCSLLMWNRFPTKVFTLWRIVFDLVIKLHRILRGVNISHANMLRGECINQIGIRHMRQFPVLTPLDPQYSVYSTIPLAGTCNICCKWSETHGPWAMQLQCLRFPAGIAIIFHSKLAGGLLLLLFN